MNKMRRTAPPDVYINKLLFDLGDGVISFISIVLLLLLFVISVGLFFVFSTTFSSFFD